MTVAGRSTRNLPGRKARPLGAVALISCRASIAASPFSSPVNVPCRRTNVRGHIQHIAQSGSICYRSPNKRRKPQMGPVRFGFRPRRLVERNARRSPHRPLAASTETLSAQSGTSDANQVWIANVPATGERTGEAAKRFGMSAGRVRQIRDELRESWLSFQGEAMPTANKACPAA